MLNEGDPVTVLKSNHSDVHKGTLGVIESIRGEGYAVKITGRFGMSEKERSADQTRTIWFHANAIELSTEANPT